MLLGFLGLLAALSAGAGALHRAGGAGDDLAAWATDGLAAWATESDIVGVGDGDGDLEHNPGKDERMDRHAVHVITVDKSNRWYGLPIGGTPGYWARNLATNARVRKTTYGFWNKGDTATTREVQRRFLEQHVKTKPKELLVFADREVMYAGCSDEELVARYNATVRDTGATVVLGAQLGFWPPTMRNRTEKDFMALGSKRKQFLDKRGLSDDVFAKWADCSDADSACNVNRTYSYVNSAFMMGPAEDLFEQVNCIVKGDHVIADDQGRVIECMFKAADKVTMDYASDLLLSTWEVKQGALRHNVNERIANNTITGKVQCFVDMNGNDNEGSSWYRQHMERESFVRDLAYPKTNGVWWRR